MIALCVGHSRKGDRGAASVGKVAEWDYNAEVADLTLAELRRRGVAAAVYNKYDGLGYSAAMNWLGRKLRDDCASAAVELHFNAAGPQAKGCEFLYWHKSSAGLALARFIHGAHRLQFPEQTDRGVKGRTADDRGALFLQWTPCPAVICEPFFGSNHWEWFDFSDAQKALAHGYARGISDWVNSR